MVPGLRVPTVFCPTLEEGRPPSNLRFDLAERNFVVVLADDRLVIADDWCGFCADTWERCQGDSARCVPIQLTENAWPLDPRLRQVNFSRAFSAAEGDIRNAFVVRRIVVELCRYLANLDEVAASVFKAPITLFLSHTKVDLNTEPRVAQQFIDSLGQGQPIDAWVDSGDIATGSKFAEAIEQGVGRTSLLAVLTDGYATREWCREEVLLAKEHQRPVVVVDALTGYEVRSFPYVGNVPRIRWDGDPQKGVDLLLKETLRHLHAGAVLEGQKEIGDVIFTRPPELATLVGLDSKAKVLYPDPPVGAGELRRLKKTGISIATPLERLAADRLLAGRVVALSMSESTDLDTFGMDPLHLEGAMLDLSRYLLIKGATLAYGGHLGAEGYTQRLFELVRTHNSLDDVPRFERIVNHRGWPLPRLSEADLAKLHPVAKTVELPRPAEIDESLHPDFAAAPKFFPADKSPEHRFAWARGMSEMRAYQADQTRSKVTARIVIGGTFGPTVKVGADGSRKEQWYASRIPGVLEEIVLSVQAGQPVFLIGAFGGVPRMVIDLLRGKDRPEATWEYQKRAPFAPEMRELYKQRGLEWFDYPDMVKFLRDKGLAGLNPLLSEDEQNQLFEAVDPFRMVELVLAGLGRS